MTEEERKDNLKIKKYFVVLVRNVESKVWHNADEFDSKEDAVDFIFTTAKEEGYVDTDMKIEIIYRWE